MKKIFVIFLSLFLIHAATADDVFNTSVTNGCATDILGFTENVSIEPVFEPKSIQCSTGQYLPINTATCENCPSESTCTPGTYTFNETKSQGITYNESFTQNKPKGCAENILGVAANVSFEPVFTPKNIQCAAGRYLPAGSETCATCPADAVYCPGGTYTFNENDVQGITACPTGYTYNTDAGKTDITDCQMHCNAGTYVPQIVPQGYTQLEYLESSGTQWIDTGYVYASNNLARVVIEEAYIAFIGWDVNGLSGSAYGGPNVGSHGGKFSFAVNGDVETGVSVELNARYRLDLNALDAYFVVTKMLDDTVIVNESNINNSSRTIARPSFALFGYRTSGGVTLHKSRIYSAKLYDNRALVRDMIPVRRDSDDALGMYDLVNNVFYPNAGTGTFIAGPDVIDTECVNVGAGYYAAAGTVNYGSAGTRTACPAGTYSNNPNATSANDCIPCTGATYNDTPGAATCTACPTGYTYNNTAGKDDITDCQIHCDGGNYLTTSEDVIPNFYTKLSYIESDGNQYIDTGYVYTDNRTAKVVIDTMFTAFSGWNCHGLSGGGYGGPNVGVSNRGYLSMASNGDVSSGVTATTNTRYLYTLDLPNGVFTVRDVANDELLVNMSELSTGYRNKTRPSFTLFGYRSSDTGATRNRSRIYRAKLYDNGILVRNLIPVRNGTLLGMYDTVSGTFFTNVGTGTFIAGPDVGSMGCVNVGLGHWAAASTVNYGSVGTRTACPAGLSTVGYGHGADSANDCARTLHIGNYVLYGRRDKITTPSLNIKLPNEDIYYISLSTTNHNLSRLHLSLNGNQYTAYDDSLFYGERDFDTGTQIVQ